MSNSKKYTLISMKELASKKNGECLSEEYINIKTHLKWKCELGHIWQAKPNDIRNGSWCPVCSQRKPLTLEEMQGFAAKRGGKCLSTSYNPYKMQWECKRGHVWEQHPQVIKGGSWCRECFNMDQKGKTQKKYSIHHMQLLAKERNGKCLSDIYNGLKNKLLWECEFGHTWYATPNNVLYGGHWCHKCAKGFINEGLKDAQTLAGQHNGVCLSDSYISSHEPLIWQCENGHVWKSPLYSIQKGRWCNECAIAKRRFTLKDVIDYTKSVYNGSVLSKSYPGSIKHMEFRCNEGHLFKRTFSDLRRNRWCPECKKEKN